jgi:ribosome-associated protein
MQDQQNDDGLGGRSRDRREFAQDNQRWGLPLFALADEVLHKAPIPALVREELAVARSLGVGRARNRSIRRVDMLVSHLDDEEIAAIDAFLKRPPDADDPRLERWFGPLLREGDAAVERFRLDHPEVELQGLRQILRNARKPALVDRAHRALRELLLALPVPDPDAAPPGGESSRPRRS